MHNFKYKPNRSTILGLNHVERIKNISTLPQINKLEFLKNKNISTNRQQFSLLDEQDEIDSLKRNFVKLDKKSLTMFFTGNYLFNQCQSYLSWFVKNAKIYSMTSLKDEDECEIGVRNRFLNDESNIFAVEMMSRHKGGRDKNKRLITKYKVFIEYKPKANENDFKSGILSK